jgi:hypothetical protein
MFLSSIILQAAIIFGVVVLFLVSVILNSKVKAPKGVKLPEKCGTCPSNSCIIKMVDVEKKKEEMKEYLKECEENENTEKK